MSRVSADRELCVGSGTCEAYAPEVFEVGDDGLVAVLRPEPSPGQLPAVREAVAGCPARALALEG